MKNPKRENGLELAREEGLNKGKNNWSYKYHEIILKTQFSRTAESAKLPTHPTS